MNKITTFLWFNGQALEAAKYYCSIFKKSKLGKASYYDASTAKSSGQRAGSVMTVPFTLFGNQFMCLNGGPQFKFTEAISITVNVDTQKELDYYWKKLTAGGKGVACGWLKDKYGLFWQITPSFMGKVHTGKDKAAQERMMAQMMKMVKLDFEPLKKATLGK